MPSLTQNVRRGRGRPRKVISSTQARSKFKPLRKFATRVARGKKSESESEVESNKDVFDSQVSSDQSEVEEDNDDEVEDDVEDKLLTKKAKSKKKEKFTEEVTEFLLECYSDMQKSFDNPGMMRKKLWEKVANSITLQFGEEVTGEECNQRFRTLTNRFNKVRLKNRRSGVKQSKFTYSEWFESS